MLIDRTHRGWIIGCLIALVVATVVYIPYARATLHGPTGGSLLGLTYAGFNGAGVDESLVPATGPDGSPTIQLVVTPVPGDPPMKPCTYVLEINPNTLMASAFGSVTDPTWYSAPGPIPIAQFTYQPQGPTLAQATYLGTVGARPQSVWSTLDPSQPQSAFALYRFSIEARVSEEKPTLLTKLLLSF